MNSCLKQERFPSFIYMFENGLVIDAINNNSFWRQIFDLRFSSDSGIFIALLEASPNPVPNFWDLMF